MAKLNPATMELKYVYMCPHWIMQRTTADCSHPESVDKTCFYTPGEAPPRNCPLRARKEPK